MKKRVRIYKAQEGGTPQQPQYSDEQLISSIMTIIGEQGGSPEDALNQLVAAGVDQARASQLVESAVSYINSQVEERNAQMSGQDYEANKLAEENAALDAQAEADQEYEARQQRYQQMMADNESNTDYGDDTDVASSIIAKFGGALPNKRTFVSNVMKLAKKQMGGDGTSNKADDTDTGERKGGLSDFITGLQGHANEALMKQDAEAMYDMYTQDIDNDFDYGYDTDQDYMQLGGMRPGQMRRMNRRTNRMIGKMPAGVFNNRSQMFPSQMNIMGIGMPMMGPQGFTMPDQGSYAGGPRLANIDVRRTGLFGRPKEYTITFAQEAYNNPKLREDVVKQEVNNQQEKAKEIWTEVEVDAKNTATEKNAEVQSEAEKTKVTTAEDTKAIQDQGSSSTNNGTIPANTEITKAGEKPKVEIKKPEESADRDEEVREEVSYNTDKLFQTPDLSAFYNATADQYKNKNAEYYAKSVKVNGKEQVKKYTYLPATKEWFREGSTKPITDKEAIKRLNTYKYNHNNQKVNGFDMKLNSLDDKIVIGKAPKVKPVTGLDPTQELLLSAFMGNKIPGLFKFKSPTGLPSPGIPGARALNPGLQFGGMTMEDSGLYKFIYGGDDAVPVPFEENTADPYFQKGGSKQAEYQAWFDRMYGNDVTEGYSRQAPVSYDQWMADYYPDEATVDKNKEDYEKAKAAGINVGEYREGIKYADLHKFPKMVNTGKSGMDQSLPYNNPYIGNMYNPQVGAMYPPLFGGRQFGPAGRTIQYAGSWAQQQGLAYDPRTGKPVSTTTMGNLPVSKIDVTKSSLFGKRPKEYTMYFGDYGQYENKGQGTSSNNSIQENESNVRRQKLADFLLRTPGLRQVGARMYPSSNIPYEKESQNNTSSMNTNNTPTSGIKDFVNDQLNVQTNRKPYVGPATQFGDYAPYNPDMIDMQQRNSFPDYYEFGEGMPNTSMAYGGYLPQAQSGIIGVSDIEPMPELKPKSSKEVWESVEPEVREAWGLKDEEPEIERQGYAAKFKNKNMYNIDFERGVNQFNALTNFGIQKLGEIGDKGIQQNFYDNLTGDNIYGSTNLEDRGTYDTNSGLFRPDQMGFKGIVRNGGFLQEGGYAMPEYDEDEEAYMTQDEIDQFLADGGELEYL